MATRVRFGLLFLTLAASLPGPAGSVAAVPGLPAALARQVDEAIQEVLAKDGTPSASVAIVQRGQVVYAKAFGFASIAPRRVATSDTRYQLASASKSITAQTLLLLAADGTLSLDAPVARWLPQVTDAGRITVRELLEHASGLPDHYPANGFGLYDMIGNVWEWTSDWYGQPQQERKQKGSCCVPANPRGARKHDSVEPGAATRTPRKVLKGGSHLCAASYCQRYRPAARHPEPIDTSTSHVGFRCVVRS